MELYNYVNGKIKDNDMYYVFLDEVQVVDKLEKSRRWIMYQKNVDEYITSFNTCFLSEELATFLFAGYVKFKMFPLSFKEHTDYYKQVGNKKL